jgi:methionine synthase II (cobalamin-independent)
VHYRSATFIKSEKKKTFKQYARKLEEAKIGTIPMLKHGKGNNFYKFKAALSEAALRVYGDLDKLIEHDIYYVPVLDLPDYKAMGIAAAKIDFMKNEAMKELAKEVGKINRDKPKLYGLIRQHMDCVESRDEVSQQPNYPAWHVEKDPEKLWQAIVKTHKVDCFSNVTEVMTLVARKAYQNINQGAFKGLSLYSERFHETY